MKPIRTVFVLLVLAVAVLAPTAEAGKFTFRGTVTRVVDGDTLDVRLTSGTRTRVRLAARACLLGPRLAPADDETRSPTEARVAAIPGAMRGGLACCWQLWDDAGIHCINN